MSNGEGDEKAARPYDAPPRLPVFHYSLLITNYSLT
jgi:hypothetical protein